MYVGVGGVAKEVSKVYAGTGGTAKCVVKIYAGVNGIARLVWSNTRDIKNFGKGVSLSAAKYDMAGASIGNNILFAGGRGRSTSYAYSDIEVYTSPTSKSTPLSLSGMSYSLGGCSNENCVIFAGGSPKPSGNKCLDTTDAFNSSLTKIPSGILSEARYGLVGERVGTYLVFAGGSIIGSSGIPKRSSTIDVFNSNASKVLATNLRTAQSLLAHATLGNIALFAGGNTGGGINYTVETINSNLTLGLAPNLFGGGYGDLAGGTTGNYALFAGGDNGEQITSNNYKTVDVYSSGLSHTKVNLSEGRNIIGGGSLGEYCVFCGGWKMSNPASASEKVDVFNSSLVKIDLGEISTPKVYQTSASNSNYLLFAGGAKDEFGAAIYSNVDAFELV